MLLSIKLTSRIKKEFFLLDNHHHIMLLFNRGFKKYFKLNASVVRLSKLKYFKHIQGYHLIAKVSHYE